MKKFKSFIAYLIIFALVFPTCGTVNAESGDTADLVNYADKSVYPNVEAITTTKQNISANGEPDSLVNPNSEAVATSFNQVLMVITSIYSAQSGVTKKRPWVAIDLGEERSFDEIRMYQARDRLREVEIYSITEAGYGSLKAFGQNSLSDSFTEQHCAFLGKAKINHGGNETTELNSGGELTTPSVVKLDNMSTARYVLVAVADSSRTDYGIPVYRIEVRSTNPAVKPEPTASAGPSAPPAPTTSAEPSASPTTAPVDKNYSTGAENLFLGKQIIGYDDKKSLTDGKASTYIELTNSEAVIDLGKEQLIDTITVTEQYGSADKYTLLYSNDLSVFHPFAEGKFSDNTEVSEHTHIFAPIAARYIKIKSEGASGGAVCDIAGYYLADGKEINLADKGQRGDVVGVINTPKDSANGNIEQVLNAGADGFTTICSMTSSSFSLKNTWFAVDMGAVTDINRLQLVQKQDRLRNYSVYVFNDPSIWSSILSKNGSKVEISESTLAQLTKVAEGSFKQRESDPLTVVNENFDSRNYVDIVDFESIEARYVIFTATKLSPANYGVPLWSIEVYNHKRDGGTFYPIGIESSYDAGWYVMGNALEGASVSECGEYCTDIIGANPALLTDGVFGDGENRFYLGGSAASVTFDMVETKPVDRLVIYEYGDKAQKLNVMTSVDGINWNKMGELIQTINDTETLKYKLVDFGSINFCRYIRIEASEYEELPVFAEVMAYCSINSAVIASEITAEDITDESLTAITGDIYSNLPSAVSKDGYTAEITWTSDSSAVNVTNGKVTRPDVDTNVIITAHFNVDNGDVFQKSFALTVKAGKTSELQLIKSVAADEFKDITGKSDKRDREIILKNGGEAVYAFSTQGDFKVDSNFIVEFEISANSAGAIIDVASSEIEIKENGGNMEVACDGVKIASKNVSAAAVVKCRIEVIDSVADVYFDSGDGYRLIAPDIALSIPMFNGLSVNTSSTGSATLKNLNVYLRTEDVLPMIEGQFKFDKISDEKAMQVTKNLLLVNEIFGAAFSYSSTNSEAVNPETGAVSLEESGYCTLKAIVSYGGKSFETEFEIAIGNLIAGKAIYANALAINGTSIDNAADANPETTFITNAKTYDVTIELGEELPISCVTLHTAQNVNGKITGYEILTSRDGSKYEKVADGAKVDGKTTVNFPPVYAAYIRVNVIKTEGEETGLNEITAFFSPDSTQKIKSDIENIVIGDFVKNGDLLPAIGKFGSEIIYTCAGHSVSFVRKDDKYEVSYSAPDYSVSVKITAVVSCEGKSESKVFNTALQGTHTVSTTISGGGSGGGGGFGNFNVPIMSDKDIQTDIADTEKLPSPGDGLNTNTELRGHWAEREIAELINKGIVNGDGQSLKLADSITRAEFTAVVVRALGYELTEYKNLFGDVEMSDWYADIMQTGFEHGVISGFEGMMRPNNNITREEAAVILINICGKTEAGQRNYTDRENISEWAIESVDSAASLGLMNGYEDNSFAPKNPIRRDEAMVIVYRMLATGGNR